MFYSHEVLTSRKYGVATVWLVATLGAKSSLKRLSRRAILDVNVAKACETIVEPEAPMALRLQSNLLYGVSRVYLQQCGYVLADAEAANAAMHTMLRSIKTAGLEVEGANNARADQLVLDDDPHFLPELDLIPLRLQQFDAQQASNDSQITLPPLDSPHRSAASQHSIEALVFPPSNDSLLSGPVGGLDLLSVTGDVGPGRKLPTPRMLEEDIGLMLDDESVGHGGSDYPLQVPSCASENVRPRQDEHREHPSDGANIQQLNARLSDDDGFQILQDDHELSMTMAPETGGLTGQVVQQETTSETASASMAPVARKKREPKVLPLDQEITHPNRVLANWSQHYLDKMRESLLDKKGYKLAALARKNAQHWVLGNGTIDNYQVCGSLQVFSGAAMIEAFTRMSLHPRGEKRPLETETTRDDGRCVRARTEHASTDRLRNNNYEDASYGTAPFEDMDHMPTAYDDNTIEQGRVAPTPLDDRHMSSIFPWNLSAASQRMTDGYATSTSNIGNAAGPAQRNLFGGRRAPRLTSGSPMFGHDSRHPSFSPVVRHEGDVMPDLTSDAAFELFGPADQVDTQTAAQSQWQRTTLGSESAHFLGFLQAAVEEQNAAARGALGDGKTDSIVFEALLPPEQNTFIVAAQAMLHVLALGTRGLLRVEQETAFGDISLAMAVR